MFDACRRNTSKAERPSLKAARSQRRASPNTASLSERTSPMPTGRQHRLHQPPGPDAGLRPQTHHNELAEKTGVPAAASSRPARRRGPRRRGPPASTTGDAQGTAGGGGIGIRLIASGAGLDKPMPRWIDWPRASFGNRHLPRKMRRMTRHIGCRSSAGRSLALGERDCSVQRRNRR